MAWKIEIWKSSDRTRANQKNEKDNEWNIGKENKSPKGL